MQEIDKQQNVSTNGPYRLTWVKTFCGCLHALSSDKTLDVTKCESICRRQIKHFIDEKTVGKRRKCWLPPVSPPTVFSKVVKSQDKELILPFKKQVSQK